MPTSLPFCGPRPDRSSPLLCPEGFPVLKNHSLVCPFRESSLPDSHFSLTARPGGRYASGMSRIVAAHEPDAESFSGLLERLARRVDEETGIGSNSNSGRSSTLRTGGASRKQPAPQANRTETRSKTAGGVLPLSYEKALQMHRRREKPSGPLPESILPAAETRQQSPHKRAKAKKSAATTPRSKTKRHSEPLTMHQHASAADTPYSKGPSALPQHPPARTPRSPGEIEPPNLLGMMERDHVNLALEQRRTIVSVRLSSLESERLRLRAAESGISVSAYMRSCVLDADHLRAQVKRALEEMRAGIR